MFEVDWANRITIDDVVNHPALEFYYLNENLFFYSIITYCLCRSMLA
jgi:hypothetical protein